MHEMPRSILENMLATEFHWTLEYIRSLSSKDFNDQLAIINMNRHMENESFKQTTGKVGKDKEVPVIPFPEA